MCLSFNEPRNCKGPPSLLLFPSSPSVARVQLQPSTGSHSVEEEEKDGYTKIKRHISLSFSFCGEGWRWDLTKIEK